MWMLGDWRILALHVPVLPGDDFFSGVDGVAATARSLREQQC